MKVRWSSRRRRRKRRREGIHAFPRGMQAGTCLHEILEEVDFADLDERARHRAAPAACLRHRGFRRDGRRKTCGDWPRCRWPARRDRFTLAEVPNESRDRGAGVFLSGQRPHHGETGGGFRGSRRCRCKSIGCNFEPINGFMNGFIDLDLRARRPVLFRRLEIELARAERRARIARTTLAAEMERNFYTLQLCLYSVALAPLPAGARNRTTISTGISAGRFTFFCAGSIRRNRRTDPFPAARAARFVENSARIFES